MVRQHQYSTKANTPRYILKNIYKYKYPIRGNEVRKNLTAQQHYSVLQSQFVVYTVKYFTCLKYVKLIINKSSEQHIHGTFHKMADKDRHIQYSIQYILVLIIYNTL